MENNFPLLRVLVVEDELLIRWSVAETLANAGHSVLEAPDGETAVRALAETREPVDVVLLDYRLPDSNDLTLLSNIRSLSPESSVVLMTAFGTPEVTRGALELGACRVLTKPFDMHDVPALVLEAHQSRLH
jgi:two-component system, NtrC family, response regulator AtoC